PAIDGGADIPDSVAPSRAAGEAMRMRVQGGGLGLAGGGGVGGGRGRAAPGVGGGGGRGGWRRPRGAPPARGLLRAGHRSRVRGAALPPPLRRSRRAGGPDAVSNQRLQPMGATRPQL